jgi:hypothetical protein
VDSPDRARAQALDVDAPAAEPLVRDRRDRRRGSKAVVTGRLVPRSYPLKSDGRHALSSLPAEQRAEMVYEALGQLVLRLMAADGRLL